MKKNGVFGLKLAACLGMMISVLACSPRTFVLKNGITRAPSDRDFFKNKSKFQPDLLAVVDTSVIYEEYIDSYYAGTTKVPFNNVGRLKEGARFYSVIRFYPNGSFSYFTIDGQKDLAPQIDPSYNGWRGVYYKDRNEIKADMLTQVSGIGTLGKITEKFSFNGDTLYVHRKGKWDYKYVKRKVDQKLLLPTSDW